VLRGMHGMQGPLSPSDIGGVLGKQRIAVQKVLAKLVDRQLVATAGGKYSSLENAIKRLKR
jgi:predicted transcriptional regulator